ncbi:MAG: carbohydrate binding domain-containing protein, partial [Balneolales bacterium]|nr:carbohydrate binding domain-containing protein [Balneolales bacterium]
MIKATNKNVASLFVMLLMMSFGISVSAQNTIIGENIVVDGDFSGDTLSAAWTVEVPVGTADIGAPNGELSFTNLVGQSNPWEAQAFQALSADQISALAKGGNWELSFDARTTTDSTKNFHVFLGQNGGDWTRYWQTSGGEGDGDVEVDGEMKTYTLTTNITQTWDAMKLGFEVAGDAQDLFIDNVVLRRVEDNLLYDGEIVIGEDSLSAAWNPVGDGSLATYSADNGEVKISGITAGNIFDVQFIQELDTAQVDSIYAGPYEMFFDARTSPTAETKEIQVFFGNNGTGGDWTNWTPRVTLSDTMETYSLNVTATQNWPQMKIGFEVSQDTASVWFDNVIVRRVRDVPPAAPTVGISTASGVVTLAITPVQDAATYNVYFADSAFTTSEGGVLVGTVEADGSLMFDHSTLAPHPTLVEDFMAHYGVVALKDNGTASALTAVSIETSMGVAPNFIPELTPSAVGAILTAVAAEQMPSSEDMASYFPDGYQPFTIDANRKTIESGTGGDDDADLSAKMWVGFDNSQPGDFMIFYAEITD